MELYELQGKERQAQGALSPLELSRLDAYWRAANYLSAGQICLRDNPLLTEPLKPEHIKARLLGHWGTTPGLNFIYAHCNRLEGSYSEFYPNIRQDSDGLRRLFCQFSFPGGIPSYASPETPSSTGTIST